MPKMHPKNKDRCENCFFTGFEERTAEIKCLRNPPRVMGIMQVNPVLQRPESHFVSVCPTVARDHWCGDHQYTQDNAWFIKILDEVEKNPAILESVTNDHN